MYLTGYRRGFNWYKFTGSELQSLSKVLETLFSDDLLRSAGRSFYNENPEIKLNILLNLNSTEISSTVSTDVRENIAFDTRRLCGVLHVERFTKERNYSDKIMT